MCGVEVKRCARRLSERKRHVTPQSQCTQNWDNTGTEWICLNMLAFCGSLWHSLSFGTELGQNWTELGQNWDRTGTELGQNWDRIGKNTRT